tara:strand:+ start:274 stop:495 length:222 start_codon:yes stop_codon:yes gene_type:complete
MEREVSLSLSLSLFYIGEAFFLFFLRLGFYGPFFFFFSFFFEIFFFSFNIHQRFSYHPLNFNRLFFSAIKKYY